MDTDHDLNRRAARICGLNVDGDEYARSDKLYCDDGKEWSPTTNPADTAIVKRAMREKGFLLKTDEFRDLNKPPKTWTNAHYFNNTGARGDACRESPERAVTAAAVAAMEGATT